MAVNRVFQNYLANTSQPSTYVYALNDFIARQNCSFRVSQLLSSPPGSPSEDASYLVSPSPSGAWSTKANNIAMWYGNGWNYIAPVAGMMVYISNIDRMAVYTLAGVWHIPDYTNDVGTRAAGAWTLTDHIDYGAVYFRFTTSGNTITISPSSSVLSGRVYTLIGRNVTGGSCTLSLATGSVWICTGTSFTVSNNTNFVLQYTMTPDTKALVLASFSLTNV